METKHRPSAFAFLCISSDGVKNLPPAVSLGFFFLSTQLPSAILLPSPLLSRHFASLHPSPSSIAILSNSIPLHIVRCKASRNGYNDTQYPGTSRQDNGSHDLSCLYVCTYVCEKEVKSVTLLSKIALLSILGLAEGLA